MVIGTKVLFSKFICSPIMEEKAWSRHFRFCSCTASAFSNADGHCARTLLKVGLMKMIECSVVMGNKMHTIKDGDV